MSNGTPNPTGTTFFDFLLLIFKDKRVLLVVLAILVSLLLSLLFTGYISYSKDGFQIGRPKGKVDSKATEAAMAASNFDNDLKTCIKEAQKEGKDYVIESILVNVDVDTVKSDTLVEKVRIIYTIRALKDLTGISFTEKYATTSNGILKHVFGSEKENLSGTGNVFDIPLDLSNNQTKTLVTGCDYYFKYPLQMGRNEVAGDIPVNSTQDVYIYPDEDDVIKSLTIRIASTNLNIRPMPGAARFYRDGANITQADPGLHYDQFNIAKYPSRSIAYNWKNVFPGQRAVIYFEWN